MPDILHRVGIGAPPAEVFTALGTIDGLRSWWVSEARGDASPGGSIDFGFCTMRVDEAWPAERVRWHCVAGPVEWVDTEVTFDLVWRDGQTFVLFTHADWKQPVEFMHHCSTKWATFLLSLRDAVEKTGGRPAPHDLKIHVND